MNYFNKRDPNESRLQSFVTRCIGVRIFGVVRNCDSVLIEFTKKIHLFLIQIRAGTFQEFLAVLNRKFKFNYEIQVDNRLTKHQVGRKKLNNHRRKSKQAQFKSKMNKFASLLLIAAICGLSSVAADTCKLPTISRRIAKMSLRRAYCAFEEKFLGKSPKVLLNQLFVSFVMCG